MARLTPILMVALAVVLAGSGCAKRPVVLQAQLPQPTSVASTVAPPPTAATQVVTAPPAMAAAVVAPPAPAEFALHPELPPIHFDFDKHDIKPREAVILEANAQWLKAHPDYLLLIEGHCDERGTSEYNLALGDRRARSAMTYLVSRGVPASRITTISYGEDLPQCLASTEVCWSENRRAQLRVKPR